MSTEISDACGDDPGWACREVFELTDNEVLAALAGGLGRVIAVTVFAIAFWFVLGRVISHARERIIERAKAEDVVGAEAHRTTVRADTVAGILRSIALVTLIVIVFLIVLGEFGINLGPLIAGAGIAGIAIGFGAQSLVADFLSGMFMLIDDEYAVGDVVDLGEVSGVASGVVERFGLRTTKVRALDGTLWTVRNGLITRTGNMTYRFGCAVLDISVTYDTDVREAGEVILRTAEEMRDEPELASSFLDDPELMGVEALGADAFTIRLRVTTPPGTQWAVGRELRKRIKESLDREGIKAPFPQRSVWIRSDPEALLQPAGR